MTHEFRYGGKYAWATGYGCLPEMPYLETIGEDFRSDMLGFWEMNPYAPGMNVDRGGSQWGDCISVSLGWPHECYSGTVIRDLREAGIEIWRTTDMPIAQILAKRLQKKPPPGYFVVEAERGIDVDYAASGFPIGTDGMPEMRRRNPAMKGALAVSLSTWNGKDIFSPRTMATLNLHCTEKVKQLAEEKGWTNVKFTEVPVV